MPRAPTKELPAQEHTHQEPDQELAGRELSAEQEDALPQLAGRELSAEQEEATHKPLSLSLLPLPLLPHQRWNYTNAEGAEGGKRGNTLKFPTLEASSSRKANAEGGKRPWPKPRGRLLAQRLLAQTTEKPKLIKEFRLPKALAALEEASGLAVPELEEAAHIQSSADVVTLTAHQSSAGSKALKFTYKYRNSDFPEFPSTHESTPLIHTQIVESHMT
jgi:hypothetical protein